MSEGQTSHKSTNSSTLVPLGYKQTEVGVIPEDWEVYYLWEIGKFKNGLNKDNQAFGHGSKFVNLMDVFGVNRIISTEQLGLVECTSFELTAYNLRSGDVIFVRSSVKPSGVGLTAVVENDLSETVYSGFLIRFRDGGFINNAFKKHCFYEEGFRKRVVGSSSVSANTNISQDSLKKLSIPLPPTKAEQEAIAEALSDADDFIVSLEQLIAKKRHIKQGAMQELLTGKKRLPGFSGEWKETSLLDLALGKKELFDDGDWIESEHITTEGVRLIQTGNIGIGKYTETDIKKYIFEASFLALHCKEVHEGDLLICRLADPAGRACVLPNIGETKIVTSVDVTIFRPPSSTTNKIFLANMFSTGEWFISVSDRSGGTTHKRISRGALGRLIIKVPELSEQTAIASILSDMDAEIDALETKLAKARQIKQGMMHNLLTGKIRLI